MKPIRQLAATMLILLMLASCGSFNPIYTKSMNMSAISALERVRQGDHLRLKFKDGRIVKAVFWEMNGEALTVAMSTRSSETLKLRTIPFSEIVVVEKWHINRDKTVALIGGSALIAATLFFLSMVQIYDVSLIGYHL